MSEIPFFAASLKTLQYFAGGGGVLLVSIKRDGTLHPNFPVG
jgi:hypothetical protein